MDSVSLTSLTPLLDGIDQWGEIAPLLPVIIALELVLSADNAVALASITKRLNNLESQRIALNLGIFISLVLRIILILTAQTILKYPLIQLAAGLYLVFLFVSKAFLFNDQELNPKYNNTPENQSTSTPLVKILNTIILLSLTDLAFSIDSITAAVAISDQYLLVMIGAFIGVLALRFTSGLFINWLEVYVRLELAGYIAVGFVGFKLLASLLLEGLEIPEIAVFTIMFLLFSWGFSKKISKV